MSLEQRNEIDKIFANPGFLDITETILAFCDVKSLVQCRRVSRLWKDVIDLYNSKTQVWLFYQWQCLQDKFRADETSVLNEDKVNGPFHRACKNGHYELVRFLLDNNLGFQLKFDQFGQSPLHYACENDANYQVVFLLLTHDRSKTFDFFTPRWSSVRKQKNLLTPLKIAKKYKCSRIVRLLKQHSRGNDLIKIEEFEDALWQRKYKVAWKKARILQKIKLISMIDIYEVEYLRFAGRPLRILTILQWICVITQYILFGAFVVATSILIVWVSTFPMVWILRILDIGFIMGGIVFLNISCFAFNAYIMEFFLDKLRDNQ